jgi:hypothetical protein
MQQRTIEILISAGLGAVTIGGLDLAASFGFQTKIPPILMTISVIWWGVFFSIYLDLFTAASAKRELAKIFSRYTRHQLEELWYTYIRVSGVPSSTVFDSNLLRRFGRFLDSEPYGTAARRALYQPSLVGRERYFNKVVEMSRSVGSETDATPQTG